MRWCVCVCLVAWFVLTLQMTVLYYNVKRLALVGPSSFP